ncbi:MAG: hypothetical protein ABSA92_01170 [Candidatus Bathyarchaeia archaeon]
MRLDDYLQYRCSNGRCGRTAVIQLDLPHYVRLFACEYCRDAMRRRYWDATITELRNLHG